MDLSIVEGSGKRRKSSLVDKVSEMPSAGAGRRGTSEGREGSASRPEGEELLLLLLLLLLSNGSLAAGATAVAETKLWSLPG
jgi:hypothetical protein